MNLYDGDSYPISEALSADDIIHAFVHRHSIKVTLYLGGGNREEVFLDVNGIMRTPQPDILLVGGTMTVENGPWSFIGSIGPRTEGEPFVGSIQTGQSDIGLRFTYLPDRSNACPD